MYLVTKLFDDDYIEITNLQDGNRFILSVQEQKKWCDTNEVYGISLTKGNCFSVVSYDFMCFSTELDALEYCYELNLNKNNIIYTDNNWFIFKRNYKVWHVNYYVYTETEIERTYIGKNNSYTPYKQAAKDFKKEDAYKKANAMTKNSKNVKKWYVLREFNIFQ